MCGKSGAEALLLRMMMLLIRRNLKKDTVFAVTASFFPGL